ncbi:Membrane protein involved in the export of O-antigen and teichoic acid [Formosa sp. Hel1_31_208]|uniref:flippase n=1 Tax=Formosa sp. Hel1_31_208 TaxID=1798225 RepID=UPI00087C0290|nr:flippase [Formosa sp. Hel1_31_208]SDR75291.1 Membrane protein involved in the export of O-antigen and teichoic acid [Formosa sp. Hel1_31_208]
MLEKISKIFHDKDYREILFKSSHFLVFRLLGFLIAYGFSFFVIKKYGEEVYGYVALGLTLFSILVVFGKMGFDIHLTKKFSAHKNKDIGFSFYYLSIALAFIFSIAISGLIYFFAEDISVKFFNKPEFTKYLQWTVLSVPFWTIILINSGVLRGVRKNGLFSFINFFSRFFVTLIVIFFLASLSQKGGSLIMESHFYAILIIFMFSCLVIFKLKNHNSIIKTAKNAKQYVLETIPLMSSTYFYVLLLWSDKIILGVFETEVNIGVYDIVTKIAVVITFTYEAINSILAPKISNAFSANDMALLQKNVRFSVRMTFFTGLIIFIGILIFHGFVLEFLGEVYLSGVYALMVLCVGKVLISLFGPVSDILQMTGHQKVYSRIMFLTLIINLVLNYILIRTMGINGAAIATSLAFLLMFLLSYIYIRRELKINSFIT